MTVAEEPAGADDTGELASPPRVLTVTYAIFSVLLFAAYAYTLWTNQNDPGRVAVWIAHVRDLLNGAR
jgi:hypothetical protein